MAHGKIEKRGQRRRKIKPVILIVTEGSQTEPKYFEHYRNRQTNIDIRVVATTVSDEPSGCTVFSASKPSTMPIRLSTLS